MDGGSDPGAHQLAVDFHAHVHVPAVDALVAGQPGLQAERDATLHWLGAASVEQNAKHFESEWRQALTDPEVRRLAMERAGVDLQVVSVSPLQYHSWADASLAGEIVDAINAEIARWATSDPERYVGLATVALHHPEQAVGQLHHAMEVLGLRGVELPTRAGDRDFSAPDLEPFWAAAEALGAVVFLHPWGCTFGDRTAPYYFGNVLGNPMETTLALSHLIFAGVFDRHPALKICAAHGGGYVPYYVGRADHAWAVRSECHTCERRPSEYLRGMWFDSLVYRSDTLRALIDVVGADRVVLGTDYPFDMGVTDPIERLHLVPGLDGAELSAVVGQNALKLLGARP